MSLSNPEFLYGIHSACFIDRSNGMPLGIVKVLGSAAADLAANRTELFGGSNPFQWANERGTIASSIKLNVKSISSMLYSLFLGATATQVAAEAAGNVGALTNVKGTSVQKATTGIASVSALAGSEADLKFGKYMVKAVNATTVNVYASTDIDFLVGTDAVYEDDYLKITATPLTIATGADVNVPFFGLKLTGGSGTIGMTAGDNAEFYVRPINSGAELITVGQNGLSIPEFGLILYSQKLSDGSRFELEAYKCVGSGGSIGMTENAFSITDYNIAMLYDSVKNKVFDIRKIKG